MGRPLPKGLDGVLGRNSSPCEALAQVVERSCRCPTPGNVQSQVGQGLERPGIVKGLPAHSGAWHWMEFKVRPTQRIPRSGISPLTARRHPRHHRACQSALEAGPEHGARADTSLLCCHWLAWGRRSQSRAGRWWGRARWRSTLASPGEGSGAELGRDGDGERDRDRDPRAPGSCGGAVRARSGATPRRGGGVDLGGAP